jgi:hypothetical protein
LALSAPAHMLRSPFPSLLDGHRHCRDAAFGDRGSNDNAVKGGALRRIFITADVISAELASPVRRPDSMNFSPQNSFWNCVADKLTDQKKFLAGRGKASPGTKHYRLGLLGGLCREGVPFMSWSNHGQENCRSVRSRRCPNGHQYDHPSDSGAEHRASAGNHLQRSS